MVESLTKELDKLSIKKQKLNKVGFVYDPKMLEHKIQEGSHCECPERIKSIYDNLIKFRKEENLSKDLIELKSSKVDEKFLSKHCPKNYLDKIRKATPSINPDIYLNEKTYEAAVLSSGCLNVCCDEVIKSKTVKSAFAIIRPPGHHSNNKAYSGFCFLNNVYLSARYCLDKLKLKKIAIVDWDVHFGDGTYELSKDEPEILFISIHRYDKGMFYPGSGSITKIGEKSAKYFKINIPWDTNRSKFAMNTSKVGDDEYYYAFESIVKPILKEFQPELILVSSGFDAAEFDPLGDLQLSPIGYSYMTKSLMEICSNVIVALEGGYNLDSLARCSEAIIKTLLGYERPFKGRLRIQDQELNNCSVKDLVEMKYFMPMFYISKDIDNIRGKFKEKWKSLEKAKPNLITDYLNTRKDNKEELYKYLEQKELKPYKLQEKKPTQYIEIKVGKTYTDKKQGKEYILSVKESHRSMASEHKFRIESVVDDQNPMIDSEYTSVYDLEYSSMFFAMTMFSKKNVEDICKELESLTSILSQERLDLINSNVRISLDESSEVHIGISFCEKILFDVDPQESVFKEGAESFVSIMKEVLNRVFEE